MKAYFPELKYNLSFNLYGENVIQLNLMQGITRKRYQRKTSIYLHFNLS